jgi:hypothetical protein
VSCTVTFVAAPGPAFDNVTVQVKFVPTPGVAVLDVFVTARSACCGVSVALAVLFAVFGSVISEALIVAVFVRAAGLTTMAWIVSVCGVAVVTVPTAHAPGPRGVGPL